MDSGGCAEIVRNCKVGYVYSNRDELRAALSALATDDGLRARLSTRAREQYQARYTEDRYIDDYLALVARLRAGPVARRTV
jgi:glycosyltransferase involved in cell wall biosynthesis